MTREPLYHTVSKPAYASNVQLHWEGKYSPSKVRRYPATCLQQNQGTENRLFWGDNFHVLAHLLSEYRGKVDLIYLDPPFDSQANYDRIVRPRGKKNNKQFCRAIILLCKNADSEKSKDSRWTV